MPRKVNRRAEHMRKTWAARKLSSVPPPPDDPGLGTGEIHPHQYAVIASKNLEKSMKNAEKARDPDETMKKSDKNPEKPLKPSEQPLKTSEQPLPVSDHSLPPSAQSLPDSGNLPEQNNHISDIPVRKQCVEMQVPATMTEAVEEPTAESKLAENHPDESAPAETSTAQAPVKFFIQGSFSQLHYQFGVNAGKQCVANSLAAVMMNELKSITTWSSDRKSNDVDTVLI